MTRILLLGGSREASRLATALAALRVDAIFSYAGRTRDPAPQPLPTRTGGFGGVEGLVAFVGREGITHIVDATHPFAAGMSRNAVAAAERSGARLLALERPPWQPRKGDVWRQVADIPAAVDDLPEEPARVFLAIGRRNIAAFAARPQHRYLLRFIDDPETPLPFPSCELIVSRGPFTVEDDMALMRSRAIDRVVSKNAGGPEAGAKIAAARALGLPVTMIERPVVPPRPVVETVAEVLGWLDLAPAPRGDHGVRLGV